MYELTVERSFSAAHCLRDYEGPCARLHGHNYKVQVTVAGEQLDEHEMLMDFGELKALCDRVIDAFDHQYLNDLDAFAEVNPTSENLARYIYNQVAEGLANQPGSVKRVKVWESDSSVATYQED